LAIIVSPETQSRRSPSPVRSNCLVAKRLAGSGKYDAVIALGTVIRGESGHCVPITFGAVSRNAGVSRSWLYGQPDLRAEIERLREATRWSFPPLPARQRASDTPLLARLHTVVD
jgi:hypothetical protein